MGTHVEIWLNFLVEKLFTVNNFYNLNLINTK